MLRGSKEPTMTPSPRRTWILKPILAPDLTEDVPMQDVHVGRLKERKDISRAIQSISIAWPGFGHLKRCSDSKLLLAPVNVSGSTKDRDENQDSTESHDTHLLAEELKDLLTTKGFDLAMLEQHTEVVKVPSRAPKTKAQASACAKIWPVNFHPDPNIEAIVTGTIFADQQLDRIEKYMGIVVEAARRSAVGNEECNGSAMIVDPEDGRILAVAASQMDEHPMWHATMLAVDLVAKSQGGGAYDLINKKDMNRQCANNKSSETSEASPESISSLQNDSVTNSSLGGAHGTEVKISCKVKRKYVDEIPLYFPATLSDLHFPGPDGPLDVNSKQRTKRNNGNDATKKKKNSGDHERTKGASSVAPEEDPERLPRSIEDKIGPYLCTNYWVFMLKEPCALCAMALLHSRVARIFYGIPSKNYGVLGSRAILHATPGLNHRYQVWSGVLEEECNEVSRLIKPREMN